ncbi:MAG: Hpt domain-containing protein [Leptospirillia bacterium]
METNIPDDMKEIFEDFLVETNESLSGLDQHFMDLESNPGDTGLLNEIFRSVHSIKGGAGFLGLNELVEVAHSSENVLNHLRSGEMQVTTEIIDLVLESVDVIKAILSRIGGEGGDDPDISGVVQKLDLMLQFAEEATPAEPATATPAEPATATPAEPATATPAEPAAATPVDSPEPTGPAAVSIPEDMVEIFDDFLVETNESLAGLDQYFLDLEANPNDTDLLNEIFRSVHSIKGGAGFLGLDDLVTVAHASESVLNDLRGGKLTVDPAMIDLVLESIDVIKSLLARIQGEDTGPINISAIVQKLELMLQLSSEAPAEAVETAAPQAPVETQASPEAPVAAEPPDLVVEAPAPETPAPEAPAPETPAPEAPAPETPAPEAPAPEAPAPEAPVAAPKVQAPAAAPKVEVESSIRVDTARLDNVMNLVGELVLCRNRALKLISELDTRYEHDSSLTELVTTASQLNLVTTDLQLSVMKTRMQPVGKIFQKFPRMVRDLSRRLDKKIDLVIFGEETELDKSMLEGLSDPLVHLVRNSIDHGIEPVSDRVANGKPETGTLSLSADYDGASIRITIQDDGAGINTEKVKAKVLEKGLMTVEQLDAMTEKDAFNLIFLPGLSTKDQTSDLSGRGVGMDVVINNIRKIGGVIDIDSELGKGTTIHLSMPLTIAIIQTLMVRVGERLFAIPLSSIVETIRLEPEDIHSADGHSMIRLRDRIIPITRLGGIFGVPQDESPEDDRLQEDDRLNVIVVGLAEKKIALLVDEWHQQEEVVIKSLGNFLGDVKGISGATINGEGHVALILDVGMLIDSLG